MQRVVTRVADIFRHAGAAYRERLAGRLDRARLKIMSAIESCRTQLLGGHLYRCDACQREHPLYNSCRNRHCPTCQGLAARRWLHARAADILPVPYFHIVFTLPHEIAPIASSNRTVVFNLLFRTATETLRTIAADTRHGATRIGGTAVLHTWNQLLLFHPHLHCVVPNAGFDVDSGQWKTGSRTFFAPVKVLASLFRRRFLEELARAHAHGRIQCHGTIAHLANPAQFHAVLATARSKDWNVYAKRPFRNTKQVFRYLSRYTHRIAIGDSRITGFDADTVAFRYRKPTRNGHRKPRYAITTVTAEEFIRRFLLHALPRGLHRIRHFGILANGCRAQTLDIARRALGVAEQDHHTEAGHPPGTTEEESPDHDTRNLIAPRPCPHCSGVLRHVREIPLQRIRVSSRDPPCAEPAQSHSR